MGSRVRGPRLQAILQGLCSEKGMLFLGLACFAQIASFGHCKGRYMILDSMEQGKSVGEVVYRENILHERGSLLYTCILHE